VRLADSHINAKVLSPARFDFFAVHSRLHNRFFYKDGKLSEQRIELLNAVNFSWTAADAKLKRDNMGQGEESRAQGPFEEEEGEGGKKQACRHDKAESKHVHEVEELGEERKRLKL